MEEEVDMPPIPAPPTSPSLLLQPSRKIDPNKMPGKSIFRAILGPLISVNDN